jgi:hypothetical protein
LGAKELPCVFRDHVVNELCSCTDNYLCGIGGSQAHKDRSFPRRGDIGESKNGGDVPSYPRIAFFSTSVVFFVPFTIPQVGQPEGTGFSVESPGIRNAESAKNEFGGSSRGWDGDAVIDAGLER